MINSYLLNQIILAVVSIVLVVYCWYIQYKHNEIVKDLTKKIMAKSYTEVSQAELAYQALEKKKDNSKASKNEPELVKL